MNFKMIAAAAALVAAGTANAALDNFASGNSSAMFFAYNTTTGTSVAIDLGVNMSDFMPVYTSFDAPGAVPQGALDKAGATATWNFGTNATTINGVAVNTGANAWSTNFNSFINSLNVGGVSDFKWAVIAADATAINDPAGKYLTTGTPTAAQLAGQDPSATANMANLDTMYANMASRFGSAANGSYYASASSDGGYAAKNTNFNTQGNWQTNTTFQAVVNGSTTAASSTNMTVLTEDGTIYRVGVNGAANGNLNGFGTLKLDTTTGTLSWAANGATAVTPSVPEPSTAGLALVGLLLAGAVARRRAAK